jgi:cytochrome c553
VADKYVKKDSWEETMLAIRAAFEAAEIEVDMALGSALAAELWRDFPHQTDWLMQDSPGKMADWVAGYRDGKGDVTNFLKTDRDASLERRLIENVLPECGPQRDTLQQELDTLITGQVVPEDRRWLDLYVKACGLRRQLRLRPLLEKTKQVIFAKHHNMGGGFFAYTEYTSWAGNKYGGLCRLDLDNEEFADGKFATVTTLISTDTGGGIIRDPALSYDATRLLFAWRKGGDDRYYKIYEMELATRESRLITGADTYGASYDPCYLPDGNILFVSSRVVQSVDCAGPDVSNFFICDRDGGRVRRVGFDQVHTLWPTVLDDGRVVYMRWDYNDRSQIYPQGLLQMNPDGTGQTEFYGNNTWEPTTLFHPCGIRGTTKVMAAMGGHHNPQCGKLGIIDTAQARQGLGGVTELPSGETPAYPRRDAYAQEGDQYCYPYPLDGQSLLVSYDPIAYHLRAPGRRFDNKNHMRFHLYYMTFDGRREVLSADTRISSLEPIPVMARPVPTVQPSKVDYRQTTGVFYLQDIYQGPGLAGIPRGTIKKLRVVELRYREMNIGRNSSSGKGGGATVVTPIAVGTGTWDVKVILGDATVHEDGSAMFRVPARTPVYFQALDENNRMIQTMRSWATLMPGEQASCVGCHEHKNRGPATNIGASLAMKAGPEKLAPFYGPPRGFSFAKEIQPILDRHCVECHRADGKGEGKKLLLTGEPVLDANSKRYWSRSYLTLTATAEGGSRGKANELVNWISNSSEPCAIPPQYGGSTRSKLIAMHDEGHHDVKLSREEMDKLAAWIDLVIPFCGDYVEAAAWSEGELNRARERIQLRQEMDAIEQQSIVELINSRQEENESAE